MLFKISLGVRNLVLLRFRLDDQQRRFARAKLHILD